jgi:hypothetical protein
MPGARIPEAADWRRPPGGRQGVGLRLWARRALRAQIGVEGEQRTEEYGRVGAGREVADLSVADLDDAPGAVGATGEVGGDEPAGQGAA